MILSQMLEKHNSKYASKLPSNSSLVVTVHHEILKENHLKKTLMC